MVGTASFRAQASSSASSDNFGRSTGGATASRGAAAAGGGEGGGAVDGAGGAEVSGLVVPMVNIRTSPVATTPRASHSDDDERRGAMSPEGVGSTTGTG
ncbi:hypothetical protein FNH06_19695 [Amycolatopsis acidiphila]|uniref:Uncharacterized protein n=1 Tax=Amycolatopsis acidiphila TaxID=715473 RepID=A0A558A901_9PSEU|nr:hypothetical protein FNH06_19695 [Amycolatopsis acidiphila]